MDGPTMCTIGDVLEVSLAGRLGMSDYIDVRRQVLEAMREDGARHLLLDLRDAVFRVSATDVFFVASTSSGLFSAGSRRAVIVSASTLDAADVKFADDVAANRGAAIRWFTDIEHARHWLAESPTSA